MDRILRVAHLTLDEELAGLEQEVADAFQHAQEDEEAFKLAGEHLEDSRKRLLEHSERLQVFKAKHNIK